MPSIQELREKRTKVKTEILQIRDKVAANQKEGKTGDDLYGGAESRARWTSANDELNKLDQQIAQEEETAAVIARGLSLETDERGNARVTDPEHRDRRSQEGGESRRADFAACLQAFCAARSAPSIAERHAEILRRNRFNHSVDAIEFGLSETHDYRSAQDAYLVMHPTVAHRHLSDRVREARAMSSVLGGSGALLVPPSFIQAIELNMLAVGGVERVAEIITTQTGENLSWPTADDTGNEGRIIGENRAKTDADLPTLRTDQWGAYEFTSDMIKVPNALIEDSPYNLEGILTGMLGERIGRGANRKWTTGTSVNEPRGFLVDAALGKTAASATEFTPTELLQLESSVDPSLRERNTCGYMMHDNILGYIRQMKDDNGNFIWQPGLRDGVPDRLLGRPYSYNQHMDSAVAASNKVVAFGDFRQYKIRRVRTVRFVRLSERFAENNQTAFCAILRQDGKLLNTGTNPIKYLKMAAS